MDLHTNTKFAQVLLDKLTEHCIAKWDIFLNEVGEYVQVVCQGDDLGMQETTYISPEMYRKYIKPLHKKIYDFIKKKTKAKILMNSCGSVYDLIQDIIDAGIDVFKVTGREMRNANFIRVVKYYNQRDYSGNLIDLMACFSNMHVRNFVFVDSAKISLLTDDILKKHFNIIRYLWLY